MTSFSLAGLFKFLLSRWKRLLGITLAALVLGLAYGAYSQLAVQATSTATVDILVKIPSGMDGTASTIYINNVQTTFTSSTVSNSITAQLQPQEHLFFNTDTSSKTMSSGDIIALITHGNNTSYFTFSVTSASEQRSRDLANALLLESAKQAQTVIPDFQYSITSQTSTTTPKAGGMMDMLKTGIMLASLALVVSAGLLGLYYLFSDFISSSTALAFYFDKKLLCEIFPRMGTQRKSGKNGRINAQVLENIRAIENLKRYAYDKHAVLVLGADTRSDFEPVVSFMTDAIKDTVHVVKISNEDNPDAILAGIPAGKTAFIAAPSILSSELASDLAGRVDHVLVMVKSNTTRLRDIQNSMKWLNASGADVCRFLFTH